MERAKWPFSPFHPFVVDSSPAPLHDKYQLIIFNTENILLSVLLISSASNGRLRQPLVHKIELEGWMKYTSLILPIVLPLIVLSLLFTTLETKASPSATFTVNSTVDAVDVNPGNGVCETAVANQCTLRAAVMEANALNGQDTVNLPANTYNLALSGQEEDGSAVGDLDITDSLIILGEGAVTTIIDGADLDRIFHITGTTNINVVISGLTMQNAGFDFSSAALEPHGGGIYNALPGATLVISDSILLNNQAFGSSFSGLGGAIHNVGTLQISNTDILTNSSPGGHGVYNSGNLSITGGEMAYNSINGGGPGGTIYNTGALQVNGSSFHHNYSYFGGAVHNGASGNATLENINVFSNTVYLDGGGIFNFGGITLTSSTIYENSSNSSSGGGIYNFQGSLVITDSSILTNKAEVGFATGGGIYLRDGSIEITNSTVYSNGAETGGGLYAAGGVVTITATSIRYNQANSGAGIGLYGSSKLALQGSTVAYNEAVSVGGGLLIDTNAFAVMTSSAVHHNSAESGGGVANYGQLAGTNLTVSSNTAVQEGGGILHNVLIGSSPYSVLLTNATLADNNAPAGGGIFILSLADISVTNTIIANNGSENCNLPLANTNHSLEDSNECGLVNSGDLANADPLLGALQNNGGNTVTHLMQLGSPAIDAGDDTSCPVTDQRGETRPLDGDNDHTAVCDIGAVELRNEVDTTQYLYLPLLVKP